MKTFTLLIILILCSNYSTSYQILGILPFESKSHFAVGEAMMKSLAQFFHNVTVVSPYPQNQELHFFKDVSIASEEFDGEYVEGKLMRKTRCGLKSSRIQFSQVLLNLET
jgi:hypothetical protein